METSIGQGMDGAVVSARGQGQRAIRGDSSFPGEDLLKGLFPILPEAPCVQPYLRWAHLRCVPVVIWDGKAIDDLRPDNDLPALHGH